MSQEREAQDGAEAKQLLESPIFRKMLERTDARIVDEWRAADTPAKREAAHAQQQALAKLLNTLHSTVENGTSARYALERQARQPARR